MKGRFMKGSKTWVRLLVFGATAAAMGMAITAFSADCVLKCKMIEWRRIELSTEVLCEQYYEAGTQGFKIRILPPADSGTGLQCFPDVMIQYNFNCTCEPACATASSVMEGATGVCNFDPREGSFCECYDPATGS